MSVAIDHPILVETERFLEKYAAERFSFIDLQLLNLMGCPSSDSPTSFKEWHAMPEPSGEDLEAMRLCLPKLLSLSEGWLTETALIVMAGRRGLWPACLADEEAARKLAICALRYLQRYHKEHDIFEVQYAPYICTLLNGWLQPEVPWTEPPDTLVVCRCLFGEAWCMLFLPNGEDITQERFSVEKRLPVDAIVDRDRPPFLPGLCSAQQSQSVPLPDDLGCAA